MIIKQAVCIVSKIFILSFFASALSIKAFSADADLDKLAKAIAENNHTIKQIEINKNRLIAQKDIYLESLSKARNEISYAIINLHILVSTPEEILLITGATNSDLALSSVLFRGHLKYIGNYMESVFDKVKQLNEIDKNINKSNAIIESLSKDINENYKQLTKLVNQNKTNNTKQIEDKYKQIAKLLEKSNSTTYATLIISEKFSYQDETKQNEDFYKEQGSLKWPAQGYITKHFKEGDALGLYYNGVIIKAKSKSTIVSPAKGKIMFAGSLKSYGNTIIIKHTSSYYSIISNVHTLTTSASELVEKGQMVGLTEDNEKEEDIYYEIREDVISLNPALWLESY